MLGVLAAIIFLGRWGPRDKMVGVGCGGSTPGLGPGGGRFDSCDPDQSAVMAQLGRRATSRTLLLQVRVLLTAPSGPVAQLVEALVSRARR